MGLKIWILTAGYTFPELIMCMLWQVSEDVNFLGHPPNALVRSGMCLLRIIMSFPTLIAHLCTVCLPVWPK